MSAIKHTFSIRMTKEQARRISEKWGRHGGFHEAMLAVQPRSRNNKFKVFKFAIMDFTLSQAINSTLDEHKKARPS